MGRALRHALGAELLAVDPRLALDGRKPLLHALRTATARHGKRLALRRMTFDGLGALAATTAAPNSLDRLPVVIIAVTAAWASRARRGDRQRRDAGSEE
jgi:hypothetical protein